METNFSRKIILGAVFKGILGSLALLLFYFTVVTLISGSDFAQDQFLRFWYFILTLAFGFGIQIGLYTYLKNLISGKNQSAKFLAASGTTSTAAMISCCSHYLANILPILGISGFITIVTQYQVQLFWVGLIFNLGGILYMTRKVYNYHELSKSHPI